MSKGRLTRDNILQTAFEQASQQGLESLTIGSLATACEMSKAVYSPTSSPATTSKSPCSPIPPRYFVSG